MAQLLKTLETGTDFDICIFKSENKEGFITTTHDSITKKHNEIKYHEYYDEALNDAKHRIKQFAFNENKEVIKLSESQLYKIINESVTNILNEIGDTRKGQRLIGRVAGRKMTRNYPSTTSKINDLYNSDLNSLAAKNGFMDEYMAHRDDHDYYKYLSMYNKHQDEQERNQRRLEKVKNKREI